MQFLDHDTGDDLLTEVVTSPFPFIPYKKYDLTEIKTKTGHHLSTDEVHQYF